jgi:hypothetical protein
VTGLDWTLFAAAALLAADGAGLAAWRRMGCRARADAALWWKACAVVDAAGAVLVVPASRPMAGGAGITAGIALALWWWLRRKGRKRSASWLGAKSRALRDAIVRKARDLSQPRPVLVPGGAR